MKITRSRLKIFFATSLAVTGAAIACSPINRMLAAHTFFVRQPYPRELGLAVVLILLGASLCFELKSAAPRKRSWEDEI